MSDKKLKITLVKSTIGAIPKHRATVKSMGFKKLNSSVVLPDNDSTRGQIQQIKHMVKVEEALTPGTTMEVKHGIIKFETC